MRIPRYTILLLVSLIISPIFISNVFANDHVIIDNDLTSEEIIDDEELLFPNNLIAMYYSWPNLIANGRVAYRSITHGFEILNMSDPEVIKVINEFHIERDLYSSYLTLNSTLLYLSVSSYKNWSMGFYVYDISNHENTSISQYFFNSSLSDYYCYGIYVKDSYLYYLVNDPDADIGGVIVFDCSNATHPIEVGRYFHSDSYFRDLVITNNYAYLMNVNYYEDDMDEIQIINMANISALVKVGEITDESRLRSIECQNDRLFLVSQIDGLRIFDLTDPIHPQITSSYNEVDGYFQDICLTDSTAYIVKSYGCSVLDLSDINNLEKIGDFNYQKERGGFQYGLIEDDLLYLHRSSEDPDRMLFILDVSNPKRPTKMYPSWIAPKWAFNELAAFLVIIIIPPTIIFSIIVFIVFLIVKRKRRRKL